MKTKKEDKENEKDSNCNKTKHAFRAQAESRGDKVDVCWYDQSYDMTS